MQFTREQYLELMTFGQTERPMFAELMGLLVGVEEEWRQQGATQEEIDLVAFDWDFVPVAGCGVSTGPRGGYSEQVLEETPEYVVRRDYLGRTTKLYRRSGMIGLPLDHPVRDMDSWLRLRSLYTYAADRIDWETVAQARRAQAEGALVVAHIPGAFDTPRQLMGEELACLAYHDQPELMHDILSTLTHTALRVFEQLCHQLVPDQLSVHEDLAGKSGPLVGPAQIPTFIRPYFRAVWDLLSSHGTRIFQMDTDGNVNAVIPAFLDCGLTCIYPMEPAAGMDVVEVRRRHGSRLAMLGGIDKHVLRRSRDEIRRELECKMQPQLRQGGMVFGLDHRIPNGTPLANYRYYVDLGREILGLPPRQPSRTGWRRMAF
ncbi:MAG: uroporphyrinogen decarboxylase family protein [Candidatus Latescibacterota bacterium]